MDYLPGGALDHLRVVTDLPDLTGTRYRIEGELGRGGMGVVYRARDLNLDREVALKVLDDPDGAGDEPRIMAHLEHPGIVPLYDAGKLPDGRPYYAMKLVEGLRFDGFLAKETRLPERLRMFRKVCEAVAFAHSRGVIHRDLKPQNVMVGAFGEALVMDWGVARRLGGREEPGTVVGTPRYMPPEQAAGLPGSAGPAADIYSLGMLLDDIVGPGGPRPLRAICGRARAESRGERYASVEEFATEIERFMDGFPVTAYRENPLERAARFGRRNSVLLLLMAAYVAVRFLLFLLR